jgi:hypothetical protein
LGLLLKFERINEKTYNSFIFSYNLFIGYGSLRYYNLDIRKKAFSWKGGKWKNGHAEKFVEE